MGKLQLWVIKNILWSLYYGKKPESKKFPKYIFLVKWILKYK